MIFGAKTYSSLTICIHDTFIVLALIEIEINYHLIYCWNCVQLFLQKPPVNNCVLSTIKLLKKCYQ